MTAYKLDHVGVAVASIDAALGIYRALGLAEAKREVVPGQKVTVAFLPVGESRIELLEPTSADSPVARFLEKRGGGVHHLCFAVENLEGALADLSRAGFPAHSYDAGRRRRRQARRVPPSGGGRRRAHRIVRAEGGDAMKVGEYVLVQLVNPREKFWGLLKDRDGSGLTIRGLSLEGFEGWLHEISRKETVTVLPTTVFFPLHRVERVFLDESAGDFVSFAERFKRTVGEDARYYLTPIPDVES